MQHWWQAAAASRYHPLYKMLDIPLGKDTYITESNNIKTISWIFKCRGELLFLNYRPWISGQNYICSLCNTHENEDVYHFVARCPILSDLRLKWFNVAVLNKEIFLDTLNGTNWVRLAKYLEQAWVYRFNLIQEFNY